MSGKQKAEKALKLKDQGGERFLKGDFTGALVAYAAALQTGGFSVMDEGGGDDGKQLLQPQAFAFATAFAAPTQWQPELPLATATASAAPDRH